MWSFSSQRGLTLIELLVTLLLVSLLASVALPYAQIAVTRDKEIELRRSLREIRTAVDRFHQDWEEGLMDPATRAASVDGYPKSLPILVEGIDLVSGEKRKYLRRIPRNPLADQRLPREQQWFLLGYRDARDTMIWGGQDVYDIRVDSDAVALDGSAYAEW